MIPGQIYRHPRMLDTDLLVLDSSPVEGGIRCRVQYLNRRDHRWMFGVDEIVVKTEDLKSWKTLSTEPTQPKAS
jgi:hypothetical protein